MLRGVSLEIRNDCEVSRALDCSRKLALMTRAGSVQTRGKNLALVRNESAKSAIILVIDPAHASFAERAALGGSSHFQLILVFVVVVRCTACSLHCDFFIAHRGRTDLVLVQGDEIADDAIIELERALILGENGRLGREARDDVVA